MNNRPLNGPQKLAEKDSDVNQITQATGSWIALAAFLGGASVQHRCTSCQDTDIHMLRL